MKTVRVLFLLTLGVPMAFLGCPGAGTKPDRTPNGWAVRWHEQGMLVSGRHDKYQLYALFDAAMTRAELEVEAAHGIPAAQVEAKFRSWDTVFHLVDHYHFKPIGTPVDFPNAIFATGEEVSRYEYWLAFFSPSAGSPDLAGIPADAPAWTIHYSDTYATYFWGVEIDGNQYPALGYELGHAFGF
jgi:hypothetical protein